jgi:hypothetical protein
MESDPGVRVRCSVDEDRKYLDELRGHVMQSADDAFVRTHVLGGDRRDVVVLDLIASTP